MHGGLGGYKNHNKMEEVKRNIKTFLEILQIGKTESVTDWDESNFKRAQRWAQYAEEVGDDRHTV